MLKPVVYYLNSTESIGKIVAVSPVTIGESERQVGWQEMRITEGEWRMFLEGNENTQNWYVHLDQETQIRRLRNREQKYYRSYSNMNPLSEAIRNIENPELIIERDSRGAYLRMTDMIAEEDRVEEADFWLTKDQDQSFVYGRRKVKFDFSGRRWLFVEPSGVKTTIYTNSRFQRVRDERR